MLSLKSIRGSLLNNLQGRKCIPGPWLDRDFGIKPQYKVIVSKSQEPFGLPLCIRFV